MDAIGIDIGGSFVKAAAMAGGACARTARAGPYEDADVARIEAAVAEALAALGVKAGGRVGVCAPGLVEGGRISVAVNLPRIVGWDIGGAIARLAGAAPAAVISDARAAAHDAWCEDPAPGRLLAVSIGTGVGACVLDDGRPLIVSGSGPGHLGQFDVSLGGDAPVGPDGGKGSLEAYIGARALARAYGAKLEAALAAPTAEHEHLRALARAVRIAHAVYRPQRIVLLGGIGVRLAPALPVLRGLIRPGLTAMAREGWTIACGRDEFHAARGAARLAALSNQIDVSE